MKQRGGGSKIDACTMEAWSLKMKEFETTVTALLMYKYHRGWCQEGRFFCLL